MEEFVKKPIELRIYGKDVSLKKPTFAQAKNIKQKTKEDPENALEQMEDLLIWAGMPAEMVDELELEHMRCIQDLLLGSKKN